MKTSASIIICLLTFIFTRGQHLPNIEEVTSLRNVGNAQLSPDGKAVAYTVQTTDGNDNRYDTEANATGL